MSELRRRERAGGDADPAGHNGEQAGAELDEALAELDRLTRRFAGGVDELGTAVDPTADAETPYEQESVIGGASVEPASDPLETRMAAAEEEAHRYLERAKDRADKLLKSMIDAVEREAEQLQREAEQGIRSRWDEAEAEAGRYVEQAQCVSEEMITDRRQRIGELSDRITVGAGALAVGMEDAERIRGQFEGFVHALARTASRIANSSARPGASMQSVGTDEKVEDEESETPGVAA